MSFVFAEIPNSGPKSIIYRSETKAPILRGLAVEFAKNSGESEEVVVKFKELLNKFVETECLLGDFETYKDLSKRAHEILKLKPKDTLCKALLGKVFVHSKVHGDFNHALHLFNDVRKDVNASKYSELTKTIIYDWMMDRYRWYSSFPNGKNLTFTNAAKQLVKTLRSEADVRKQRYLAEHIVDFYTKDDFKLKELVFKSLNDDPGKSSEWIRNLTFGEYRIDKAWKERGGGYANTVSKDGWKGFRENLKVAYQLLKKAHDLRPNSPEPAARLITVSMGGGTEEGIRYWFEQAIKAEFDYENAYHSYLLAILPRWGGSHNLMVSLGKECAATNAYDTIVPWMFLQAALNIHRDKGHTALKATGIYPAIHDVMKNYESFQEKTKSYVHLDKRYVKSIHFLMAKIFERHSHILKIHELYGEDAVSPSVLKSYELQYKKTIDAAYAYSGEADQILKGVEDRIDWTRLSSQKQSYNWDFNKLKDYENVLKDLIDAENIVSNPKSSNYFKSKKSIVNANINFIKGGWVDLSFDKHLSDWLVYDGNFKYIDNKTIEGVSSNSTNLYISHEGRFEPPYAIEVEVETEGTKGKVYPGMILGQTKGPVSGRIFWVDGRRGEYGFAHLRYRPSMGKMITKSNSHKIRVNFWNGYFEMMVDGKQAFRQYQNNLRPLRVGLGISPKSIFDGKVRFKNFRIKKLNLPKLPGKKAGKEKVEFFKQRLNDEPYPYTYLGLAEGYTASKEFDKALETLQEGVERFESMLLMEELSDELRRRKKYLASYEVLKKLLKSKSFLKEDGHLYYGRMARMFGTATNSSVRDGKKAIEYSKKSLKYRISKPQKVYYLESLAYGYATDGNFKEAIKTMKEAIKLTKNKKKVKTFNERLKLFENNEIFFYK